MATAAATGPPTLSWIGWIKLANRNSFPCEWRSSDSAKPRSRAADARCAPYEDCEQALIAPMIARPTTGGDSDDGGDARRRGFFRGATGGAQDGERQAHRPEAVLVVALH